MPLVRSLILKEGQIIARVRIDRTEIVRHGDVFPHFEGVQYRALGSMTLIEGPEGDWHPNENGGFDVRLVEVGVRRVAEVPFKASGRKRRGRGPNGAPSSDP